MVPDDVAHQAYERQIDRIAEGLPDGDVLVVIVAFEVREAVRAAAGGGTTLDYGAATKIPSSEAVRALFASGEVTPVERFRALDDLEWSD